MIFLVPWEAPRERDETEDEEPLGLPAAPLADAADDLGRDSMHLKKSTQRTSGKKRNKKTQETCRNHKLHQKGTQVRFWFPARIPAPHDLPWNWLLENVNIKKSTEGSSVENFEKPHFYRYFHS